MELEIWRYSGNDLATLGMLMERQREAWGMFCFTCEDAFQEMKVPGKTRIPAGRYEIKLRNEGGMSGRYGRLFPQMHRGMLWLQDVPDFTYVYIHVGNTNDDTEGCILVGEDRSETWRKVCNSKLAYLRIYPQIAQAVELGGGAWITIRDLDRPQLPTP